MKKILYILIGIICLCSCSEAPTEGKSSTGERKVIQNDGTIFEFIHSSPLNLVDWFEIEKDGNRHEFIWVDGRYGGVTHWPDCKYCKERQSHVE